TVTLLARHPLARALRVDKLTLAALEATLTGPPPPVGQAMAATPASIRERAEAQAERLATAGVDCRVVPTAAAVGGGGGPGGRVAGRGAGPPRAAAPRAAVGRGGGRRGRPRGRRPDRGRPAAAGPARRRARRRRTAGGGRARRRGPTRCPLARRPGVRRWRN